MKHPLVCFRYRVIASLTLFCLAPLLTGCSSQQSTSTPDEVKALGGDPAAKAQANAAGQAAAAQQAATAAAKDPQPPAIRR